MKKTTQRKALAAKSKLTRKSRHAGQQLLAVCDPRTGYKSWRESIGQHLLAKRGRVAAFARGFEVTDNVIGDWFTLRRTDPPGWVVHFLTTEDGKKTLAAL